MSRRHQIIYPWLGRVLSLLIIVTIQAGGAVTDGYFTMQIGDVDAIDGRRAEIANVRGVFVGLSQYSGENYPKLPNAAGDAQVMAAALAARCGLQAPKILLNERATLAKIKLAFEEIATEAGPDDLIVFHFSGHGIGLTPANPSGSQVGGLLLYNAPPKEKLLQGDLSQGVLRMDQIRELMPKGMKAKHRLVLLDSCFGGLGASSRDPALDLDPQVDIARYRMLHAATYTISAGGDEQKVLDGPEGGRGLLTGAFINLLRTGSTEGLLKVSGRNYLSLRGRFEALSSQVLTAAHKLQAASLSGTSRNQLVESGVLQVPKEHISGQGHIYLPWRVEGPLPAELPLPGPAATPSGTAGRGGAETLAEWCARTPRAVDDPGQARRLDKLARLLTAGPPPCAISRFDLEIKPSIRIRADVLRQALSLKAADPAENVDDTLYPRVPNADWISLSYEGGVVTDLHELRLVLKNHGASPVYLYVMALDCHGTVEAVGGDRYGASLADGGGRMLYWLPGNTAGSNSTVQNPTDAEIALIVIATTGPWTELAELLADPLLPKAAPSIPISGLLAVLPPRFGSTESTVRDPDPETSGKDAVASMALKAESTWVGTGFGWRITPATGKVVSNR